MASKIILCAYTPDMERLCAAAMRSCNSPYPSHDLYTFKADTTPEGEKPFDEERVRGLLQRAVELGHQSILEHAQLTFDLQSVSRSCTHQLVRHRLAAYSQQSQRHVRITRGGGYIRPPSINKDTKIPVTVHGVGNVSLTFDDVLDITRQVEEGFLKLGVKIEDARYVRPNAAVTNIVTSMNARELLHVFRLRCASSAQWEIRDVAWAMFACTKLVAPNIFRNLPGMETVPALQEKNTRLEEIVDQVRPLFMAAQTGDLVEIPLERIMQEHPVLAFAKRN